MPILDIQLVVHKPKSMTIFQRTSIGHIRWLWGKHKYICKIISLYTIANLCAVLENIHDGFYSSLIIMGKHSFFEPQPDSYSYTSNDLPTLWKVASWACTDITIHCCEKFEWNGKVGAAKKDQTWNWFSDQTLNA